MVGDVVQYISFLLLHLERRDWRRLLYFDLQGVSNGLCQYISEYLQYTPDWEVPAKLHKLCSNGAVAKQVPLRHSAASVVNKGGQNVRLQQEANQLVAIPAEDDDADLEEVEEAMQEAEQKVAVRLKEGAKRVATGRKTGRSRQKPRPSVEDD
jgi:hypothetical protein